MGKTCAICQAADIIGKRWSTLILLELCKGKKRYNEIKKSLEDITPKILSLRLKELEKEGIVKKSIDSRKIPVSCTYQLTTSGEDFIKVIESMKLWALRWRVKNEICQKRECKDCRT